MARSSHIASGELPTRYDLRFANGAFDRRWTVAPLLYRTRREVPCQMLAYSFLVRFIAIFWSRTDSIALTTSFTVVLFRHFIS